MYLKVIIIEKGNKQKQVYTIHKIIFMTSIHKTKLGILTVENFQKTVHTFNLFTGNDYITVIKLYCNIIIIAHITVRIELNYRYETIFCTKGPMNGQVAPNV